MQNDNIALSIEALKRFNAHVKPDTSTQMKTVVAALFLAEADGILKYTNLIGLLQLDQDRQIKGKMLRMYHMETLKLAFEVELYFGFLSQYKKLDDKFYYFDYPVGSIGLLFRTKEQADIMLLKIKSNAPTLKESEQFIEQIKAKERKQQQSKSALHNLKNYIWGTEEVVESSGQIQNFKKIFNATIDAEGNLYQEGKSPLPVDIIDRIKLSEKDKKNPEIMNLIATDLLIHQLKKEAIENPRPEIMEVIKEHQQQEDQYLHQCAQTKLLHLPPPPPPPPLLSPLNRISMVRNDRTNLMEQIRNHKLQLKHVQTNEKGGINIDLSTMDTVDRDDFASALRKKIAQRKKALNKYSDSQDD